MNATLKPPIYLDYMATTPVDPRVITAMMPFLGLDGCFGNAASNTHQYGWQARAAVDKARAQVAALINAEPAEIIWTSGATESDNLALFGAARFYQRQGKHIITCETEHKAVLDSAKQLAREGFTVTFLPVDKKGFIDLNQLADAITDETSLVSIMHVNNEIGVIQDIARIAAIVHERGALLHVDAAQSAGKIPVDAKALDADLMSFSGHKVYGPKGVGALYIRQKPRVRLQPMIYGGGHENGLRSGTLAVAQIVAMGEAFRIAADELDESQQRLLALRDRLWQGLQTLDDIYLNGDLTQRVPGNLNVSFDKVEGEALLCAIKDLAVSTTSACSSASIEPSYVLRALQVPDELAHSSIRLSFGRFTTEDEIDFAIETLCREVKRLRQISPL
jgi:cysteine desulfurase